MFLADISVEDFTLWFWLGVFVVMFVIEASTQALVSVWFGLGALVTLCISGFTPWWVELIVFSVVSAVTLFLTRPLVKKITARSVRYTNLDETIGRLLKLEKDVTEFEAGEVKLNGILYTAVLPDGESATIKKGTIVEVVSFKGNKVVIRNIETKEEKIDVFE